MSKKGRSAMQLSRRDFLKFSVPATTGLIVAGATGTSLVAAAAESSPPELTDWALLHTSLLCQGPSCRACTNGCRDWNHLTKPDPKAETQKTVVPLATNTWTAVNDQAIDNPDGTKEHNMFKAQCRHCTNPSCVAACPTGAMSKHGDYTSVDQKWCIGCGYCAQACPFGVPQLGEPKHTSTKCRFCWDRLTSKDKTLLDPDTIENPIIKGLTTSCAFNCPVRPVKALRFGKRAELIAAAKKEVADLVKGTNPYTGKPLPAPLKDAHLYGDTEAISGGSHVLFILTKPNSFYGLEEAEGVKTEGIKKGRMFPEEAQYSAGKTPTRWGTGVATAGALAILPFWLLFRRKQELASQQSGVKGGSK